MILDPIGIAGNTALAAAVSARFAAVGATRVIVHGLLPAAIGTPRKRRIEQAANLFDLASECDAVITAYGSHDALRAALTGTADRPGLLGGLQPGSIVLDFSPGTPDECRRLAGQLAGGAIGYIELAETGGIDAMAHGTAQLCAGGFGDHIAKVTGVLSSLGTLTRIGPQGSARMYVALMETVRAAHHMALYEAQQIATAHGFVPEALANPPLSAEERAGFAIRVAEALAMAHGQATPLVTTLAQLLADETDGSVTERH